MDPVTPGASAPAGATTDVAAPAQPAPAPASEQVAAPSHGDWAGMAKTLREQTKLIGDLTTKIAAISTSGKPAASEPAPRPPSGSTAEALELAEIKSRLALDEVLDDLGIPLTRERRNMMRRLHAAERPTDVGEWASRTVDSLGWKVVVTAAAVTPPVVPAKPFDPGAPAGAPAAGIPLDPAAIPQSVVEKMTPEEALIWWQRYKAQGGAFVHPFDAARRKEASVRDGTADVARQIAIALQGVKGAA